MSQLVQPDRYKGADGVYKFTLVPSAPGPAGMAQPLFTTPDNAATIVRFVNVILVGGGSVGTYTVSLYGLYSFGLDSTLGYGGELVSACPATFQSAQVGRVTWSTDVDTAYFNSDPTWNVVANVPLPITYLPPGTVISVESLPAGGSDAAAYVDLGQVVVELVNEPTAQGGAGELEQIYLLPVNQ